MTLTLLIDLDDTLLANDSDIFIPAYFKLLSAELAPYAPPEKLVKTLLDATHHMIINRHPDCTLKEAFDHNFYPLLGLDAVEMEAPLEHFYRETFPRLRPITNPVPGAVELIDAAFERGYRVIVATNPLFPTVAMEQRLDWAGLPVERYPFTMVTSYENLHFAKPDSGYHAEILACLGWPDGPVAVVGDNPKNDIDPAHTLGLPAFWIDRRAESIPAGWTPPEARGPIDQVLPWLEELEREEITPTFADPNANRVVLRSTPAALDAFRREMSVENWHTRPAEGQWCPAEILCHLRDVDREVNLPRLEKILAEENPFLPGMDTDSWARERDYVHQDGLLAFAQFVAARQKMVDLISAPDFNGWDRMARHAILGPTRLSELLGISAAHDRLHLHQFLEALPE